jgi:glycosyltransferase involved in cell wall biosynthesis
VHDGVANGLKDSIKSIISQDYENIELIVVDDASSDFSVDLVNQLCIPPHCKIIVHRSNQGLAASLNDGISSASGEYIMIVQQDCALLSNDTISKSIEFMSRTRNVDILVGRQIYDLNTLNFYQKFSEFSLDHFLLYTSACHELDLTENKCDIIRKEIIGKIGLFDISQRVSGEDQVFSNRALKLGLKMYLGEDPKFSNQLLGENTLSKVLKKHYRYGRYSWSLYKKMYRHGSLNTSKKSYATGKIYNRMLSVFFSLAIVVFLAIFLSTLFYGFFFALLLILVIRIFFGYKKLSALRRNLHIPKFPSIFASLLLILTDIAFSIGLAINFLVQSTDNI